MGFTEFALSLGVPKEIENLTFGIPGFFLIMPVIIMGYEIL
ncbi:hypothetical protein [Enteractinococcus helveticum]|nr:hypothetical protein [Enteractinococcus helveticum]